MQDRREEPGSIVEEDRQPWGCPGTSEECLWAGVEGAFGEQEGSLESEPKGSKCQATSNPRKWPGSWERSPGWDSFIFAKLSLQEAALGLQM